MKNNQNAKNKKVNPSAAREKDVRDLEMSLKDEANGFYHFENAVDDYIED